MLVIVTIKVMELYIFKSLRIAHVFSLKAETIFSQLKTFRPSRVLRSIFLQPRGR